MKSPRNDNLKTGDKFWMVIKPKYHNSLEVDSTYWENEEQATERAKIVLADEPEDSELFVIQVTFKKRMKVTRVEKTISDIY